jgi:imidazolonepropionase-like amidohydrolase
VLRSATSINAELLGLTDEIGTLRVGAAADLLAVEGDPLKDIAVLTEPQSHLKLILAGGRVVVDQMTGASCSLP